MSSPKENSVPAAWDGYDAYLFDIDGTLLNCTDAVHYFAFCETLHLLAGRPLNLDGVMTHGSVDERILRDALTLAEVPEREWRPRLPAARQLMCDFVAQRKHDLTITVLPAVRDLLSHLKSRGAVLGVATGNLAGIGRTKLTHCGLLDRFDFGGFSDTFEHRRDVFRAALAQARQLAGPTARVCVVGDTPEDVRSARANGLDVIAVATGIFTFEDLQQEHPDWCLRSFEDLLSQTALPAQPHAATIASN